MSFDPLKFLYTPPVTIVPPYQPSAEDVANVSASTTTGAANSRAASLISRLNEMAAASKYLQQVILEQSQYLAVPMDFTVNPDISRALTGIYSTDTPPSTVTIPMYNKMLDAEIGTMVADIKLGPNSPFMSSTYQQGDLMTVTRAVEEQLLAENTYESVLPTLLRTLKGDEVIFNSWSNTTQSYPVMRYDQYKVNNPTGTIGPADVDMSADLSTYMDNYVDRFSTAYAGIYKLTSGLNVVEQDINSVLNQYFYQSVADLISIVSMLTALKSLNLKATMKDLSDDLVNFAFVRLQCELFTTLTSVNRIVNVAVTPFKTSVGTISRMAKSISGVANTVGYLATGGLKGMMQGSSCSTKASTGGTKTKIQALNIPGMDAVTGGLASLGAHMDWAQREILLKEKQLTDNLRRANERLVNKHGDSLEVLCSLRALGNLISFAMGIINNQKVSTGTTYQTASGSISSILSTISTGTGTTFSVDKGTVIASPPSVPAPSQAVTNVLVRGGLTPIKLS